MNTLPTSHPRKLAMQPQKPRRRWKRYVGVLLLLLLAFGIYRIVRPDPNLKKVKQLQAEFASAEAKNWTPEQRQEKGREMRAAVGKLSESQREAMGDERRQEFEKELKRYAAMTPVEKTRHLDEQINRSEQFRQRMAQQNPGGTGRPGTFGAGPGGGGGPGGPRGPSSAEEREKRRKERLDRTTPEFRALMDQYRKDMETRRRQRGLPTGGR
jgi:hypothetical protein